MSALKILRVEHVREFRDEDSDAFYGSLKFDGHVYATCERGWHDNIPGGSCIPEGFYTLEPHDGGKYKNTYALVGQHVSHYSYNNIPRTVCVIHWEDDGRYLQGCVSIGERVEWFPNGASKLRGNKIEEVLAYFRNFDRIYWTITERGTG